MSGGMRLDNDSIRALPLHMQEQVAMAFVAQPAKAIPVAGREEVTGRKVRVRRLRFQNAMAAWRYLNLRLMVRTGIISDLVLQLDGGYVRSFTYTFTEEIK